MPKRKPIEIVEELPSPQALIISGGTITEYLSAALRLRGCQVVKADSISISLGKFDYIFQFGNLSLVEEIYKKHLKVGGKFLFIETDEEEVDEFTHKFKILRIGEPNLWIQAELVDQILKTMFSSRSKALVDLRKKSKVRKVRPPIEIVPPPPPEKILKSEKIFVKKRIIFFCLALVFILLSTVGSIYWYIYTLESTFSSFQKNLASSNFEAITSDFQRVKRHVTIARIVYDISYKLLVPLRDTPFMKDLSEMLSVTNNLVERGEDTISYFQTFKFINISSFADSATFSKGQLEETTAKINSLVASLSDAKKRMEKVKLPFVSSGSMIVFIDSSLQKLTSLSQVLPVFGELFVTNSPKTYLLLFQNNMEVRPTGGFIGSFGILTLNAGRVVDFKIIDVYDADGQLKGHVEPPAPIRKHLSQPNFFLRDSNFDPDFAVSAAQASWFLQKELGTSVDGVIGLNLFLVQEILRIVGPIEIADFGSEIITADNFFFKAHYFSQKDFFAGSREKKDFLKAVSLAIQQKLAGSRDLNWIELLSSIKNSLDNKNILIFSTDEGVQQAVEQSGWAGRMVSISCLKNAPESSCYPDYLSINEANLGVNKANYFVEKSVSIEKIVSSDGQIVTNVILDYENKSIGLLSGGYYTNYLRLFTPQSARLLSLTLNGVPISPTEVDVEPYGSDKTSFGLLVKIAPENKGVIKWSYVLERKLEENFRFYQFLFQKQAGDKTSPLVFLLQSSTKYPLSPINFKSLLDEKGELSLITDTSVDRIFALEKK